MARGVARICGDAIRILTDSLKRSAGDDPTCFAARRARGSRTSKSDWSLHCAESKSGFSSQRCPLAQSTVLPSRFSKPLESMIWQIRWAESLGQSKRNNDPGFEVVVAGRSR